MTKSKGISGTRKNNRVHNPQEVQRSPGPEVATEAPGMSLGGMYQAAGNPHLASPEAILALQRQVGNQSVQRLVQRSLQSNMIQREGEGEEEQVPEEVLTDNGPDTMPGIEEPRASEESTENPQKEESEDVGSEVEELKGVEDEMGSIIQAKRDPHVQRRTTSLTRTPAKSIQRSGLIQRNWFTDWFKPKKFGEGVAGDLFDPFETIRSTEFGDRSKATESKKKRSLVEAENTVSGNPRPYYDNEDANQANPIGLYTGRDLYSHYDRNNPDDTTSHNAAKWGKTAASLLNPVGGAMKGLIKGGELGFKDVGESLVYGTRPDGTHSGTAGYMVDEWSAADQARQNKQWLSMFGHGFKGLGGALGTLFTAPLTLLTGLGGTALGTGAGALAGTAGTVGTLGRAGYRGIRALSGEKVDKGLGTATVGLPNSMVKGGISVAMAPDTWGTGATEVDSDGFIDSKSDFANLNMAGKSIDMITKPLGLLTKITGLYRGVRDKYRAQDENRQAGVELGAKKQKAGIKGIFRGTAETASSSLGFARAIQGLANPTAQKSFSLGWGAASTPLAAAAAIGGIATGGLELIRNTWGMVRAINKKNKIRKTKHHIDGLIVGLNAGQNPNAAHVAKAQSLRTIAKYAEKKKNKTAWLKGMGGVGAGLAIGAGVLGLAGLAATPVGWGLAAGAAAVGLGVAAYKGITGMMKKWKRLTAIADARNNVDNKDRGFGWKLKQLFVWNSTEKRGKRTEERITDHDAEAAYDPNTRGGTLWANLTDQERLEERVRFQNNAGAFANTKNTLTNLKKQYKTNKTLMAEDLVNQLLDDPTAPSYQYAKDLAQNLGVLDKQGNLKKSTGLLGWLGGNFGGQTSLDDLRVTILNKDNQGNPAGPPHGPADKDKAAKEKAALVDLFKRKLGSG